MLAWRRSPSRSADPPSNSSIWTRPILRRRLRSAMSRRAESVDGPQPARRERRLSRSSDPRRPPHGMTGVRPAIRRLAERARNEHAWGSLSGRAQDAALYQQTSIGLWYWSSQLNDRPPPTHTKVSPTPSSDRSEVARLVSCAREGGQHDTSHCDRTTRRTDD
jgi:hypothetical protein